MGNSICLTRRKVLFFQPILNVITSHCVFTTQIPPLHLPQHFFNRTDHVNLMPHTLKARDIYSRRKATS